jgi:hypothetical protein
MERRTPYDNVLFAICFLLIAVIFLDAYVPDEKLSCMRFKVSYGKTFSRNEYNLKRNCTSVYPFSKPSYQFIPTFNVVLYQPYILVF